ncbi:MAG: pyridine nucleotide-disulfide oxidoreductase, partial [Desulfocapsa sp.]|nr:pyridine nucleotide-disulfide oxidoreductase [Desulfocapsa sp.]
PSAFFKESGLQTGLDGGLLVNKYLQCPKYPEIFGGGDCVWFGDQPLAKVGVYAVRENPVLFHNLKAQLQGTALQAFDPGGDYLLIFNLGNKLGVLRKNWFQISGWTAFIIKDWIDRKFMKKFQ